MSSPGSLQCRLYRIFRRDGLGAAEAARLARISIGEARLFDADDRRDPPTPECFVIPPGMARRAICGLDDTPLGAATIARWSADQQENRT